MAMNKHQADVRLRAYRDQLLLDVENKEKAALLHKEKMLLMSAENSAKQQLVSTLETR